MSNGRPPVRLVRVVAVVGPSVVARQPRCGVAKHLGESSGILMRCAAWAIPFIPSRSLVSTCSLAPHVLAACAWGSKGGGVPWEPRGVMRSSDPVIQRTVKHGVVGPLVATVEYETSHRTVVVHGKDLVPHLVKRVGAGKASPSGFSPTIPTASKSTEKRRRCPGADG